MFCGVSEPRDSTHDRVVCADPRAQITLSIVSKFNFENMLRSIERYKVGHLTYVVPFASVHSSSSPCLLASSPQ